MKLVKTMKTIGISLAIMLGVGAVAYGVSYHTGAQTKIENSVVSTYNKIQDGVVSSYKNIENGVVSGSEKVESVFVPSEANK